MKPVSRFGLYVSAGTSRRVLFEVALGGRCLVLRLPWLRKPPSWGYGFIFHHRHFWLFRGMDAICFKPCIRMKGDPPFRK